MFLLDTDVSPQKPDAHPILTLAEFVLKRFAESLDRLAITRDLNITATYVGTTLLCYVRMLEQKSASFGGLFEYFVSVMSPSLWNTASLFFLLVWLFTLHSIAIFLFTDGFLLRRTAVSNTSDCTCQWHDVTSTDKTTSSKQCWMDKRFEKIVIVVIDSLRIDFAQFDAHLPPEHTPFYRNKLPIIHELLSSPPEESDAHIFRFIADPPTTTMQRLKGLTTGSLPTFIDAGANFASSAIAEDNWMTLARDNGLTSVLLGDDTWLSLFPQHFRREFGYNPFDVKDLHTVDNGILKDLFTELKKPDWNILVAHFEGVDHVGHRLAGWLHVHELLCLSRVVLQYIKVSW